ncbi:rod shape-determining protein MreC [Candidatus Dependentiae bacterium]|nr:rod shape-determining protein MreC [Candidatus Dependentiae bacterium]
MQKQFDFNRLRFFIILLIMSVILFFFRDMKPLNQIISVISKPVFIVVDSIKYSTLNVLFYFKSQKALIRENQLLKKENLYLRWINSKLVEKNIEYKKIAEDLDLVDFQKQKVVHAKVIGRSSSQWFNSIIINKGAKHGIILNTPVILGESLIGRVQNVYYNTSRVILITDSRFTTSGILREERFLGIIKGRSSPFLDFQFEYHKKNISEPGVRKLIGEVIVTSGFDKYIIKGIVIGKIKKVIESDDIIKKVAVAPMADLDKLEFVQVLIPEDGNTEFEYEK